ncbi:MAG: hypothetical protein M0Q38_01155 [Bacteroidales bacterium]|nr:hypothetical protein [Bacteroidales bacterium]
MYRLFSQLPKIKNSMDAFHNKYGEWAVVAGAVGCAGTTSTPMFWSTQPHILSRNISLMDPLDIARYGLKKLGKTAVCIPG